MSRNKKIFKCVKCNKNYIKNRVCPSCGFFKSKDDDRIYKYVEDLKKNA
jgi:ribosomal protein L32